MRISPKWNQSWIFIGRTDAEAQAPVLWQRDGKTWERLKAGGEGDDRGWDGWMASLTRWTSVWPSSGCWWWTGKPGVLQSMGHKESDMTEWLKWSLKYTEKWFNLHAQSLQLCPTPLRPHVACQAPVSMGFSLQAYWNGLPWLPPEDLLDPGNELTSLMSPALAGRFFTTCTTWEACFDLLISWNDYHNKLSKNA